MSLFYQKQLGQNILTYICIKKRKKLLRHPNMTLDCFRNLMSYWLLLSQVMAFCEFKDIKGYYYSFA